MAPMNTTDTRSRAPGSTDPPTGPVHANATPEHRRGRDPPRPVTVWASRNAVLTIPGHRDLSYAQPRNLVDRPPAYVHQTQAVAGNERRTGATVWASIHDQGTAAPSRRMMRNHGNHRLWEQAQEGAVISEAVHMPQRRYQPNEIQIRARSTANSPESDAATHRTAYTTPPTSYPSSDSVISDQRDLQTRSNTSPPRHGQTLMDHHDLLNRAPTTRSSLEPPPGWGNGVERISILHVRQEAQRLGQDVHTPPNPHMEPAWRYGQFYDTPVSTQRQPREQQQQQQQLRRVRARSPIIEPEHPTASYVLLMRPPMPASVRVDCLDGASLRSATTRLSRRVSSLFRTKSRALSEATGLAKVYRKSRFHEHLDGESFKAESTEATPQPVRSDQSEKSPERISRRLPLLSLSPFRRLVNRTSDQTPQPQSGSFSHSRGHCTTNPDLNLRARCPSMATARLRPDPGPSTLPAINEEDFRVRPSPNSSSSSVPRHDVPFVPYTGTGKAPAQPRDLRPLSREMRQYNADQARWTAERAPSPPSPKTHEAQPSAVAPTDAEVIEPGCWIANAVGECQRRRDAERRYEGGERRLRVANGAVEDEDEDDDEKNQEGDGNAAAEDADDESSMDEEEYEEEVQEEYDEALPSGRKDTLGGDLAATK